MASLIQNNAIRIECRSCQRWGYASETAGVCTFRAVLSSVIIYYMRFVASTIAEIVAFRLFSGFESGKNFWFSLGSCTITSNPWTSFGISRPMRRVRLVNEFSFVIDLVLFRVVVKVVVYQISVLKLAKAIFYVVIGSSRLPYAALVALWRWNCWEKRHRRQLWLLLVAQTRVSFVHASCLMNPHDKSLIEHLLLGFNETLVGLASWLIEKHVFGATEQRCCFKLREGNSWIAFIAWCYALLVCCERRRVVWDRKRVGTDALDERFALTVLLQYLAGVYRWLQLLQFFKESHVFISNLLITVLNLLLVERFSIDYKVGACVVIPLLQGELAS